MNAERLQHQAGGRMLREYGGRWQEPELQVDVEWALESGSVDDFAVDHRTELGFHPTCELGHRDFSRRESKKPGLDAAQWAKLLPQHRACRRRRAPRAGLEAIAPRCAEIRTRR